MSSLARAQTAPVVVGEVFDVSCNELGARDDSCGVIPSSTFIRAVASRGYTTHLRTSQSPVF